MIWHLQANAIVNANISLLLEFLKRYPHLHHFRQEVPWRPIYPADRVCLAFSCQTEVKGGLQVTNLQRILDLLSLQDGMPHSIYVP